MTYFTTVAGWGGRTETKIDLARFAGDLARELGTTATKPADDIDGHRWYLPIGADTMLWVTANGWKKRVTLHIEALGITHDERNYYAAEHKTKDATVNPDGRPIAAIARDIKRRVIDAAAPALAARRKYAAELRAARAGFKTAVADLKTALPGLDIRHRDDRRADIYGADGLAAELHYDDTITIKRLTLTPATFTKVMELINAPDAAG